MYGYDNEIANITKKELHALISDAVKEGILAAMKESGRALYPDSERPREGEGSFTEPHLKKTPDGETGNAKSYLGVVRKQIDRYCDYLSNRQVVDIMTSMMSILNIVEVRYVLSHIDEGYEPSNRHEFDENSAALLQWFAANQQKK
jgi:hypothetical protein